jgi:hypothetical protein
MGKKMNGQENTAIFLPHNFSPQNCLLLERGTDGALAGISGLSFAAGRYKKSPTCFRSGFENCSLQGG